MRNTFDDTARRVMTSSNGRATLREVDDNHLCQECKSGDTGFSRTHTDFEMWHPTGMTSVPMKQKQDQQQQGQQGQQGGGGQGGQGGGQDGTWNKKQPQGEAAEAMVLYINGSAAHPVGMSNDRRVRPYDMDPGESALYSVDGSGQTVYHRTRGDQKDGVYVLTCDDQGGGQRADGSAQQQQKRFVSIRHANKPKQSRKPQKRGAGTQLTPTTAILADGQQQQRYKHEGDSVNTEVQLTSGKINFNDGGGNVGFYDNQKKDWLHHDGKGATHSMRADKDHSHIKHEGAHIWVDGACWSSMPIQIKGDPCS